MADSGPHGAGKSPRSDKLRRQLDAWRRQLVALDRRQRQLYFKHNRTASVELIGPSPSSIAGLLDGKRPVWLFTLVPDPNADEPTESDTNSRTGAAARVPSG